jgi:hypothetical protein
MVCPTCGLENDPSSTACARCNTGLTGPPAVAPGLETAAQPPHRPAPYRTASYPPADPYPPGEQPTAPIYPGAPAYSGAPRTLGRLPLFAAAAGVLVIAVIAAAIIVYRGHGAGDPASPTQVLPGAGANPSDGAQPGPDQPTAEPTGPATDASSAHDQAVVIDDLLGRSVASRRKLNAAIDLVSRCTALTTALSQMREVGAERQQQLDAVGSAELSALADGDQLRAALSDALRHALAADQAYVSWTEPTITAGCANTTRRRTAFAQGRAASDEAQAAKKRFLAIWNPTALQEGLPQRSNKDI